MTEDNHLEAKSHLSAVMDGEADAFELRRTLDRVGQDPELRAKWHRYQLAASAMRGEPATWRSDLSGRIAEAVAAEPVPRGRMLTGVLGRTAVAASVAVLTIAGVRLWLPFNVMQSEAVADAAVEQPAAVTAYPAQPPFGVQLPLIQTVAATNGQVQPVQSAALAVPAISPAEEQRVRRYVQERMIRHADVAARRDGLLPLVRVPRAQEQR